MQPQTNDQPKISVYSTCKNNAEFLKETLDSILAQTFQDFEIVLTDGNSTDQTEDILKSYSEKGEKRLKWTSEPDDSPIEGFFKALSQCRGQYIMCMPISDKYIRKTWFQECVDVLDNNPDISMVHGMVKIMSDDGIIIGDKIQGLVDAPMPSGKLFFPYWLATFSYISEITYCVRRDVYIACYPPYKGKYKKSYANVKELLTKMDFEHLGPHMKTIYNFNKKGYLAHFLNHHASAGRDHGDALSIEHSQYMILEADRYCSDIIEYREELFSGATKHIFRDGQSNKIGEVDIKKLQQDVTHFRETCVINFGRYDEHNPLCMERKNLFQRKAKEWLGKIGTRKKVAIYAGGQHTEQLLRLGSPEIHHLNIVAIIDKNPPRSSLSGIPIIPSNEFDYSSIDHIIISSKAFEDEIFGELSEVFTGGQIERIYFENNLDHSNENL